MKSLGGLAHQKRERGLDEARAVQEDEVGDDVKRHPLVVAVLVIGPPVRSSTPARPPPSTPGFDLASGWSSSTITSNLYPRSRCGARRPRSTLGLSRCMVFSVHNNSERAHHGPEHHDRPRHHRLLGPSSRVRRELLDATHSRAPSPWPGAGDASSPGVPIELKDDSGSNQTVCQNPHLSLHLLGHRPITPTRRRPPHLDAQPVHLRPVGHLHGDGDGGEPSTDASLPSGTVTSTSARPRPSAPTAAPTCSAAGPSAPGGRRPTTPRPSLRSGPPTSRPSTPPRGPTSPSVSGVVAQVVNSSTRGTSTALTSSPDPSGKGQAVSLTARSPSPRAPGPRPARSPSTWAARAAPWWVRGPSTPAGQASSTTSSLSAGSDNLYAVYGGDTHFSGSTSPVRVQSVIGLPTKCTGTYPNFFDGDPHHPFINGTNGADFVYASVRTTLSTASAATTACGPVTGTTGSPTGTATTWCSGATRSRWATARQVWWGTGTTYVHRSASATGRTTRSWWATAPTPSSSGRGLQQDRPRLGRRHRHPHLAVGGPTQTDDSIDGGAGNETIYLGSGSYNSYSGQAHHTNTCHLPKPPSSWHGTVAAYYHDTITNCTVVSP